LVFCIYQHPLLICGGIVCIGGFITIVVHFFMC
jgi:hypothetical protein